MSHEHLISQENTLLKTLDKLSALRYKHTPSKALAAGCLNQIVLHSFQWFMAVTFMSIICGDKEEETRVAVEFDILL